MSTTPIAIFPLHVLPSPRNTSSATAAVITGPPEKPVSPPLLTPHTIVDSSLKWTHLMLLAQTGDVDAIYSCSEDICAESFAQQDILGRTALHLAILTRHEACALALVKMMWQITEPMTHENMSKVAINLKDQDGRTPLLLAAYLGLDEVVDFLLNPPLFAPEICTKCNILEDRKQELYNRTVQSLIAGAMDKKNVSLAHVFAMHHRSDLARQLPLYASCLDGFQRTPNDCAKLPQNILLYCYPLLERCPDFKQRYAAPWELIPQQLMSPPHVYAMYTRAHSSPL